MIKYVDLQIECQRIWIKKVEVIPVIIVSTGIVDKNIKKYDGRIPGVTGQDIQHHVSPRCRDYT